MVSHLLLFSYVVPSVLFGSVVCTAERNRPMQNIDVPSLDPDDWMAGLKMLHVSLTRHHMSNHTFPDGYIESHLLDGVWYWDFYATDDWDRVTKRPISDAIPASPFGRDEIREGMTREGRTVRFSITVQLEGGDLVGSYSLVFANETDAKNFTGENRHVRPRIRN